MYEIVEFDHINYVTHLSHWKSVSFGLTATQVGEFSIEVCCPFATTGNCWWFSHGNIWVMSLIVNIKVHS